MNKNFDKILVLVTFCVFVTAAICVFWINIVNPKKVDLNNGLIFGNKNSSVKVIVFEDFKCKYCKKFANEFLPIIKKKYIDSNLISYMIVPLAFLQGSKPVANAAVIIYEMNKERFFDFLKIISDKNSIIETKKDLIASVKEMEGINIAIFEEFLQKDIFDNYLEDNLENARKILKPFQVPTIYLNGHSIEMKEVYSKIQEIIAYGERKK